MMNRFVRVVLFNITSAGCGYTRISTCAEISSQKTCELIARDGIAECWVYLQPVGFQILFARRILHHPAFVQTEFIDAEDTLNSVESPIRSVNFETRGLGDIVGVASNNVPGLKANFVLRVRFPQGVAFILFALYLAKAVLLLVPAYFLLA